MLEIKVKYFTDIEPIKYIEGSKSDWYDLRAAEDVEIKKGEYKIIPLGVAIELPKGYEALLVPRSSIYKTFGIMQVNSIAVFDEAFCGDDDQWMFQAYGLRDTVIKKNDRICQFRIIKHQPDHIVTVVTKLGNKNRGGIGTTGKQ